METALITMAVRIGVDNLLKLLPGVRSVDSYAELGEKIETLRSKLQAIRETRRDADEVKLKGHAVNDWLRKLKDAACEAEDVLDSFDTEELRRRSESRLHMKVRYFFCRNRIVFRIKITHSIEAVNKRLRSVIEEKSLQLSGVNPKEDERTSGPYVDKSEVIGRDEDKKKIVRWLLHDNGSERISVVFIVGIGGIGKTTLAQKVYDDESVREHFKDMVMWKFVGVDFAEKTLVASILELATKKKPESSEMDILQTNLREALAYKKFLLVLDDVWNVDDMKWKRLLDILQSGKTRSKVLVTTRHEGTLWNMGTSNCHHLGTLSDDQCWSLFERFAFDIGENHSNLLGIGKKIAKKCRGLPLAAMAVGGMMRSKKDKTEWLEVLNSEIWESSEDEDGILPALMLSYDDLTTEYKQCFAFCSIFPKGYEFEKENLILLWIANNFISSPGKQEAETVGHRMFTKLFRRSFFQEGKMDTNGNISKFKMHDLMHDLARRVAGDEFCMLGYDRIESIQKRTRHISIEQCSAADILKALHKPQSLRTLLTQKTYQMDPDVLLCIFTKLRFLRALDLSDCNVKEFPVSVDKLKYLRYLNLSKNPITTLPKSVVHLLNLQSLVLNECLFLRELPEDMKNLQNLRHLDIGGCRCLTHIPSGLAQLNLYKLTDFVVGKKTGCSITELGGLKLHGELNILNLENIDIEDIRNREVLNNDPNRKVLVSNKQYLKSLKLYWGNDTKSIDNAEKLLEFLEPHSNLERLNVSNYGGSGFPKWLAQSTISDLVEIKLINCTNCPNLPQLGNLEHLTAIQIIGMERVETIGENFYGNKGFPSLKKLFVSNMPILKQWQLQNHNIFSTLEKLTIGSCPELKEIPRILHLGSLKSLEIVACHNLESWPETPLQKLNSVCEYQIEICNKKVSSSEWLSQIGMLKMLRIHGDHKMHSNRMIESKTLSICCCEDLGSLIVQNSMLQMLAIDNCSSLTDLPKWMSEIRSLQYISIHNCPSLTTLPEWFQNFNDLQVLTIQGCPELQSRCTRENGADWQRISHVPHIEIKIETNDAPNTNEIADAVSERRNLSSFDRMISCCSRS